MPTLTGCLSEGSWETTALRIADPFHSVGGICSVDAFMDYSHAGTVSCVRCCREDDEKRIYDILGILSFKSRGEVCLLLLLCFWQGRDIQCTGISGSTVVYAGFPDCLFFLYGNERSMDSNAGVSGIFGGGRNCCIRKRQKVRMRTG